MTEERGSTLLVESGPMFHYVTQLIQVIMFPFQSFLQNKEIQIKLKSVFASRNWRCLVELGDKSFAEFTRVIFPELLISNTANTEVQEIFQAGETVLRNQSVCRST